MNAYIVFAGGGVKGAVLGGCLLAAERARIEPVGFGGTSAGSIVAMLASVGYSGEELRSILVNLDLVSLLDDRGTQLEQLKAAWKKLEIRLKTKAWRTILSMNELSGFFSGQHGLYSGVNLKAFLADAIQKRVPDLPTSAEEVSFDQLAGCSGCLPLRVVATDVLRRRAVIFGAGRAGGNRPVVDAVLASASFPFVFQPVVLNDMLLADGGISSNLPAFLFEREYREARTPTLAFDLVPTPDSEPEATDLDFAAFGKGLLYSALEASDVLLRDATPGVHYFPIQIPVGIETLDFKLTQAQRESCFTKGYEQAAGLLADYEPVRRGQQFGHELQRRMVAQFGPVRLYLPILRAVLDQLASTSGGAIKGARAHIMLLTGKAGPAVASTRIVVYQIGMDDDGDIDLELAQDGGCSGLAWESGGFAVADLVAARANPEPWRMSQQQHNKVPVRIKSMISVAIPGSVHAERAPERPVGTLSVDCETELANTGWCTSEHSFERVGPDQQPEIMPDVATLMGAWATVVGAMLP